jgi:hypothetical protein
MRAFLVNHLWTVGYWTACLTLAAVIVTLKEVLP